MCKSDRRKLSTEVLTSNMNHQRSCHCAAPPARLNILQNKDDPYQAEDHINQTMSQPPEQTLAVEITADAREGNIS